MLRSSSGRLNRPPLISVSTFCAACLAVDGGPSAGPRDHPGRRVGSSRAAARLVVSAIANSKRTSCPSRSPAGGHCAPGASGTTRHDTWMPSRHDAPGRGPEPLPPGRRGPGGGGPPARAGVQAAGRPRPPRQPGRVVPGPPGAGGSVEFHFEHTLRRWFRPTATVTATHRAAARARSSPAGDEELIVNFVRNLRVVHGREGPRLAIGTDRGVGGGGRPRRHADLVRLARVRGRAGSPTAQGDLGEPTWLTSVTVTRPGLYAEQPPGPRAGPSGDTSRRGSRPPS